MANIGDSCYAVLETGDARGLLDATLPPSRTSFVPCDCEQHYLLGVAGRLLATENVEAAERS